MESENYSKDCELVLGLVAPVGVNLEDVRNRLESYIGQFRYDVNFIHLSKVGNDYLKKNYPGYKQEKESEREQDRLSNGMAVGNDIRSNSKRADVYSLIAINAINEKRKLERNEAFVPLGRVVHVLRSLKHPDEVETLRHVYGHGFFLLGISSSLDSRERYLSDEKGVPQEDIERLISRDDNEEDEFGQSTSDVFQMADAFVTADSENLSDQISRILDVLFSKPVVSPTRDEYAMFMAYAASLRSADLSRQVGAVIANSESDIIATGANDVPKFGGGLYWPDELDERDHVLGYDSNERQKEGLILNIMRKVAPSSEKSDEDLLTDGRKLMKDTGLLDITEYGRAVHAEMEALLSSSRNGISTRGASLYTTTFPCHNCAKHIVAAGVKKVKYIEPYPKSYAIILHSDAIDANRLDAKDKVVFEPFVGIGPRRFVDLFSMSLGSGKKLKRKEGGSLKAWTRGGANLRVPMRPLSYLETETILASELSGLDLIGVNKDESS